MSQMLKNPSFEEGWTHPDGIPELQIPEDWEFWYAEKEWTNPYDSAEHNQFVRPEVRVLPREQLPPEEQDQLILRGNQCVKIFKGYGAWHGGLSQIVDFEPGSYELVVYIFADLVKDYDGSKKVWADDPDGRDGLVQFVINDKKSEWKALIPGGYLELPYRFEVEGRSRVSVNIMCPFALRNSGVFLDNWSLEKIGEEEEPPVDTFGLPREQYERTYVLMPPNADTEWVKAVVEATWDDKRYTIGASADDAGIGALEAKTVIAVNPEAWGDELFTFFETHYPKTEYKEVRAGSPEALKTTLAAQSSPGPPPTGTVPLIGLHDREGAVWLLTQGAMKGCCLIAQQVQRDPVRPNLDFRYLKDAGINTIVRLNWGWADGTGTIPRPGDVDQFVAACVETMNNALGVDHFQIGNEVNNRQEWPGFGGDNIFELTPGYYVDIYNRIFDEAYASMGPAAVDPYFGPESDSGAWWSRILGGIKHADALFLHPKTQTNDPASVWSMEKFADEPLTWQYLNFRTVETLLALVPDKYKSKPVYITEANPQHLVRSGGELGWEPGNGDWVHEAVKYLEWWNGREGTQKVTGVVFYRYVLAGDQAPFGLADKPAILEAILEEAWRYAG